MALVSEAGSIGAVSPASRLRCIVREFDAIDRKHLAFNQPRRVAHREHGGEDPRDVVAQRAHELRDGGEVRRAIATQRDERHVFFARPGDLSAADDPLRIREQHDREEQRERVGGCAGLVVLEARIEVRQIDGLIEQMIQRVLERAGEPLP